MSQQLALLGGRPMQPLAQPAPPVALPTVRRQPPRRGADRFGSRPPAATVAPAAADESAAPPSSRALVEKPFGASARIHAREAHEFTPAQRRWLDAFMRRYNARTAQVKDFSQQHRKAMADPRVVTGFHPLIKELVYPIVVDRSKGAQPLGPRRQRVHRRADGFGGNLFG